MVDFNDAVDFLIDTGVVYVLAPFVLIFAIVFAILQRSKVFHGGANEDDSAKKINATIAFVFGLFAVISINFINFIEEAIPIAAMSIVLILCLLIILGLLFGEKYQELFEDSRVRYAIAGLLALLAIIFVFFFFDVWEWLDDNIFSSVSGSGSGDILGFIIIAAIVIGAIYFITRSDSKDDDD